MSLMIDTSGVSISDLSDGFGIIGCRAVLLAITFPVGVMDFPIGNLDASPLCTIGGALPSDWEVAANSPEDGVLLISLQPNQLAPDPVPGNTGGGQLVNIAWPLKTPGTYDVSIVSRIDITHTQVMGSPVSNPNHSALYKLVFPYRGQVIG